MTGHILETNSPFYIEVLGALHFGSLKIWRRKTEKTSPFSRRNLHGFFRCTSGVLLSLEVELLEARILGILRFQEISNRTHWTDPKKTWVSHSSIATYLILTERGPLGFGPIPFLMDSFLEMIRHLQKSSTLDISQPPPVKVEEATPTKRAKQVRFGEFFFR